MFFTRQTRDEKQYVIPPRKRDGTFVKPENVVYTGTVTYWDIGAGHGIITGDNGREHHAAHVDIVAADTSYMALKTGYQVEFKSIRFGGGRHRAVRITGPLGTPFHYKESPNSTEIQFESSSDGVYEDNDDDERSAEKELNASIEESYASKLEYRKSLDYAKDHIDPPLITKATSVVLEQLNQIAPEEEKKAEKDAIFNKNPSRVCYHSKYQSESEIKTGIIGGWNFDTYTGFVIATNDPNTLIPCYQCDVKVRGSYLCLRKDLSVEFRLATSLLDESPTTIAVDVRGPGGYPLEPQLMGTPQYVPPAMEANQLCRRPDYSGIPAPVAVQMFGRHEKTPTSILHEFCQKTKRMMLIVEVNKPDKPMPGQEFLFQCLVDNMVVSHGAATNKKDSRANASINALHHLYLVLKREEFIPLFQQIIVGVPGKPPSPQAEPSRKRIPIFLARMGPRPMNGGGAVVGNGARKRKRSSASPPAPGGPAGSPPAKQRRAWKPPTRSNSPKRASPSPSSRAGEQSSLPNSSKPNAHTDQAPSAQAPSQAPLAKEQLVPDPVDNHSQPNPSLSKAAYVKPEAASAKLMRDLPISSLFQNPFSGFY